MHGIAALIIRCGAEVRNTATNRELVYLPVTADVKEAVGKIASLSGKAEGEVYLEAIGAKVDADVLKVNLEKLKLRAMAAFMNLDVETIAKLMNSDKSTDSNKDKVKK